MTIIGICNFVILLYSLRYYAFNETLLYAWLETAGLAFALGFGVIDVLLIVIRNNVSWMERLLRTREYQIVERIVVSPILNILNLFWGKLIRLLI